MEGDFLGTGRGAECLRDANPQPLFLMWVTIICADRVLEPEQLIVRIKRLVIDLASVLKHVHRR